MTALFVDVQTKADDKLKEIWNIPEPPDTLETPDELLKNSVPVIKSYLKQYAFWLNEEPGWLKSLLEAEKSGKGRLGIIDTIKNTRFEYNDIMRGIATQGETAEIIALSYHAQDEMNGAISGALACEGEKYLTEKQLLLKFILLIGRHSPVIVWHSFTLYAIQARIAHYKMALPRLLDMRPWGNDVIVLKDARRTSKTLEWHCQALGIRNPTPHISGDMIVGLCKDDPAKILEYSKGKIWKTRELYKRWARARVFVRDVGVREAQEKELIDGLSPDLRKEIR